MPDSPFSLAGRTALITGGSRGVGRMIATGFLEAGADVIISARKAAALEQTATELRDLGLGSVTAIVSDLSSTEGCRALAADILERSPSLDILVNNAGATWGAPVDEFPEDGWDKVIDTNVKGVHYLTAALLPALRAAASPDSPARVINIGSVDGIDVPMTENYPYSASKAAVHMLTRHWAKRVAGEHINVNAIAPGFFPSKMTAFIVEDEAALGFVEKSIPLQRMGRPEEMAGSAVYLASAAGGYLTGVVLTVDGGLTGIGRVG